MVFLSNRFVFLLKWDMVWNVQALRNVQPPSLPYVIFTPGEYFVHALKTRLAIVSGLTTLISGGGVEAWQNVFLRGQAV